MKEIGTPDTNQNKERSGSVNSRRSSSISSRGSQNLSTARPSLQILIPADEPGTEKNPNFKTPNADDDSEEENWKAVKGTDKQKPAALAAVKAGRHNTANTEEIQLSDLGGRKESAMFTES